MHLIKRELTHILPGIHLFLDVDFLEDTADLPRHVGESSLVICFMSKGYFTSRACQLELTAAVELRRPLALVHETDLGLRGKALPELCAECPETLREALFDRYLESPEDGSSHSLGAVSRPIIPWVRHASLMSISLRLIAQDLVKHNVPNGSPNGSRERMDCSHHPGMDSSRPSVFLVTAHLSRRSNSSDRMSASLRSPRSTRVGRRSSLFTARRPSFPGKVELYYPGQLPRQTTFSMPSSTRLTFYCSPNNPGAFEVAEVLKDAITGCDIATLPFWTNKWKTVLDVVRAGKRLQGSKWMQCRPQARSLDKGAEQLVNGTLVRHDKHGVGRVLNAQNASQREAGVKVVKFDPLGGDGETHRYYPSSLHKLHQITQEEFDEAKTGESVPSNKRKSNRERGESIEMKSNRERGESIESILTGATESIKTAAHDALDTASRVTHEALDTASRVIAPITVLPRLLRRRSTGESTSVRTVQFQHSYAHHNQGGMHFLLFLDASTFEGPKSAELERELRKAYAMQIPITLVHSIDSDDKGCAFDRASLPTHPRVTHDTRI